MLFDQCLSIYKFSASPYQFQHEKTKDDVRMVQIRSVRFDDGVNIKGPPLFSSGQSSWLQIQRSRVRIQALPDFPSSGGSGTGSGQPLENNEELLKRKSNDSSLENRDQRP
jgi:hypothetical protein